MAAPDYTTAPDIFENTVGRVYEGQNIEGEDSAWNAASVGVGFESRHGMGVIDRGRVGYNNENRSGLAYFVQEIHPNNTGAGASNNWNVSIRFECYDLATKAHSHYSYVTPIGNNAGDNTDTRCPGIAVNPSNGNIWCIYAAGTAEDNDQWAFGQCRFLRGKMSDDNGVSWGSEIEFSQGDSTDDRLAGDNYDSLKIDFGPAGNGMMIYGHFDDGGAFITWRYIEYTSSWQYSPPSGGAFFARTNVTTTLTSALDAAHAMSAGLSNCMALVFYDNATDHVYEMFNYEWGSSSWSLVDTITQSGARQIKQPIMKYSEADDVHHLCYAVSDGGVFLEAWNSSGKITSVGPSGDDDIPSIDMGSTPYGDSLAMDVDIDGNIHIFVTAQGLTSGYIKYSFDGSTYTKVTSDHFGWWSATLDYWFETNDDPYPVNTFGASAVYTYDEDVHLLFISDDGGTGEDSDYISFWEIVGASLAPDEPETPTVTPTADGSYLWIQSKADVVDETITDTDGTVAMTDITTTAELQPFYAQDFSKQKYWKQMWLRYTNWGDGDLTITWWTDNRVDSSKTITMNVADFVTMFSNAAELGEYLMPLEDYVVQHPVDVQTAGLRVHIKITTTQGRYSLRGIQFDVDLGSRQVVGPKILQKRVASSDAWRQTR